MCILLYSRTIYCFLLCTLSNTFVRRSVSLLIQRSSSSYKCFYIKIVTWHHRGGCKCKRIVRSEVEKPQKYIYDCDTGQTGQHNVELWIFKILQRLRLMIISFDMTDSISKKGCIKSKGALILKIKSEGHTGVVAIGILGDSRRKTRTIASSILLYKTR